MTIIKDVKGCLERLNEIALKPNAIKTEVEYIDVLIESAKQEKKLGWQEEVSALTGLRETAVLQFRLIKDPEGIEIREISMIRLNEQQ